MARREQPILLSEPTGCAPPCVHPSMRRDLGTADLLHGAPSYRQPSPFGTLGSPSATESSFSPLHSRKDAPTFLAFSPCPRVPSPRYRISGPSFESRFRAGTIPSIS